MLRALVPLGGTVRFVGRHNFNDEQVAAAIGLERWIENDHLKYDPEAVLREIRAEHRRVERQAARSRVPTVLRVNVSRVCKLVGLSAADCRILEFSILLESEPLLGDATDLLGNLTPVKTSAILGALLRLPKADVAAALAPQGTLAKSGLLTLDRSGRQTLQQRLSVLSSKFVEHIASTDCDPATLVRDIVAPASPPGLKLEDYVHITPSLSVMLPYLRQAIASGRKGVNVFLYGRPGTGKSELARVLAHEFGCELFEVASEDEDGDVVCGDKRLRALRTAQCLLANRRALVAFDEAEDVFSGGGGLFAARSIADRHKAWINRMLEGNKVPVIWLSNAVHCLDPAFVRRFDFVIEVPIPPRKQREAVIARASAGLLDNLAIKRLGESETLSPAVVVRAAAVAETVRPQIGDAAAAAGLELLIGNTLEAQGHARPRREDPNRLPETYDPAYVTADADLVALADGLASSRTGRLCLYGPPGTGKTAYGRWIAERLDMPLEIKRASDLISKWVGESEKNIANAFRRAEQSKAILLIDEVDSFLQDRRGAQRNWEVTQVNEMLTQMESYAGIFIASTNLVDGLDQAALRRFDLKVQFGFLRPNQAWRLLQQTCRAIGLESPPPALEATVSRLEVLTPGDFAAVRRQARFRPLASGTDFISALEAECVLKTGGRRKLGF